jgi:cobalt/nickel transport system ATP-binding protein
VQPLIRARGLSFSYEDGTRALNGLDFDLWPGETVALLGPNGSGKSTFVFHLNGLLHGEGELTVCGLPPSGQSLQTVRSKVGVLFQDPDDQLFMPTVIEDVAFGPLNQGVPPAEARQIAHTCLGRVGLEEVAGKSPHLLSAGEKRRAGIAGLLAMSPEVLVLDEPTTYLDPPGQRSLLGLLRELPQPKVVVTHDVQFAQAVATRAVFFERGRIVAEGSVQELVGRFDWLAR